MKRSNYIQITEEFIIDNDQEEARYDDGDETCVVKFDGILPIMLGALEVEYPATNESVRHLFTALIEFAESRGVSRHPESTLTARLEAAAFGGGK